MKNLIDFAKLFAIISFGILIGFMIADDINRDNNRLNELYIQAITIKDLYIHALEKNNDSLKTELKALKTKERYGITVADTTLFIVRKLKIGQQNERVLDVRTIHKGKNHYYFELRENTFVEMWINR